MLLGEGAGIGMESFAWLGEMSHMSYLFSLRQPSGNTMNHGLQATGFIAGSEQPSRAPAKGSKLALPVIQQGEKPSRH